MKQTLRYAALSLLLFSACKMLIGQAVGPDLRAFAVQHNLQYQAGTGQVQYRAAERQVNVAFHLDNSLQLEKIFVLEGADSRGALPGEGKIEVGFNDAGLVARIGDRLIALRVKENSSFPVISSAVTFEGYGFARMHLKEIDYDNLRSLLGRYEAYTSIYYTVNKTPEAERVVPVGQIITWFCENCGSGGTGATACHVEGMSVACGVTCGSGYYACCNLALGCRCCSTRD